MAQEQWEERVAKELAYRRTIGCESSAHGAFLRQDVNAVLELQLQKLQYLKDHADDPAVNAKEFPIPAGWVEKPTWRMLMERFGFGDLLSINPPPVAPHL